MEDRQRNDIYETIHELHNQGELEKVSILIDKLSPEDALRKQAFRSALLFFEGRYDEVIELATKIIQEGMKTKDHWAALMALSYKLSSLLVTNKFPEFDKRIGETTDLQEINTVLKSSKARVQELFAMIYGTRSVKEMYTGNYDKGKELGKKGLDIATEIESTFAESHSLYALALNSQQSREDRASGIRYAEKALSIASQSDYKVLMVLACYVLGNLYRYVGDYDNSLRFYNQGLRLSDKIGWKLLSDILTGDLGHHYLASGDHKKAIELFKHAFDSARDRKDYFRMGVRLDDIGRVHRARGNLQSALKTFQQLFEASLMIGNKFFQSHASHAIGTVYHDQGKYSQAVESFQRSLSLRMRARNKLPASNTLFALALLAVERGDTDVANELLVQLEEISLADEKNENIRQNYQKAKGLMLKTSPRMRDKVLAQDIFDKISKDVNSSHNDRVFALLNLCELLIFEYKSVEEPELLTEIKSLSQRILDMSREKNDRRSAIKALLLNSKLSLLEGDLKNVDELLEEAHGTAAKAGITSLVDQISREKRRVKAEIEKWTSLLKRNAPIRERIEEAVLEEYIQKALAVRVIDDERLQR
ncbi:MAG: tetratricopeptide repeat protein [Candidatus Hodarchaeales archaeon]|jgi:tetratricopeptide (TPR) repeat protein